MASSAAATATSFLSSAAQSFFAKSNLASNYTVASTSSPNASPHLSGRNPATVSIGLWRVQRATSNSTGKAVSIWEFDKAKLKGRAEKVIEVLKKEASLLTRLRHPCVIEVVEPLEETRSSLLFATEPVTSSLRDALHSSGESRGRRSSSTEGVDLDEVEIQKGLLQIGKALQFLHESAKLVHSNLTPKSIIVNAKGDWKLGGFGLSQYLTQPDGTPAKWTYPEFDSRVPDETQLNFDYMAPEYAMDEQLVPANDMYALGCVLFAIHTRSGPPFSNRHQLHRLRENIEQLPVLRAQWSRFGEDVQDVLSQLLTRYPSGRLNAATFQTSRYFNSVLVATLRFLDRDNFNGKGREEQASFMKGLLKILPQFSDKVIKRKVLPSLLEETRKGNLLPFVLPNIFYIADKMDNEEFKELLLPQLKPLFAVRDPPQALLTLLDNLPLFESKCAPVLFREEVMPMVYAALDSELPLVLERALKLIPGLCATLDYTTVKQILFPKVTMVFTKTTLLSVKVNTLICFHAMIPTLDKFTLTEKLVPILARIKTKEPSVMVATLAVHDEIGKKIEVDAIATLILPQLWAMSIGPLLNVDQFTKFMTVVKKLGARVEEEHFRHLSEIRRLEETSNRATPSQPSGVGPTGEVDFESLVRGSAANGQAQIQADPFGTPDERLSSSSFFGDSLSIGASLSAPATPAPSLPMTNGRSPNLRTPSAAAPTTTAKAASLLGARAVPPTSFNSNAFAPPPTSTFQTLSPPPTIPSFSSTSPLQARNTSTLPPPMSFSTPPSTIPLRPSAPSSTTSGPNYNISLTPQAPAQNISMPLNTSMPLTLGGPLPPLNPTTSSWATSTMGSSAPMAPVRPAWNATPSPSFSVLQPKKASANGLPDWKDLDPLG